MNNENVICKTECKHKKLVTIPAIIWWIIVIVLFRPVCIEYGTKIELWIINVLEYPSTIIDVERIDGYVTGVIINWGELFISLLVVLLFAAVPVVIYYLNRYLSNRCNLTVTDKQIYGDVNIMFTSKKLQMPLDKLDNIMTSNGIIDKIRGGETIIVSSNTGKIKFPYVYNATEFVNATLAAKEKYNANKTPQQNVVSEPVISQSNADELKKYKDLLDNGVITQEEFEAKKKQLLGL